MSGGQGESRIRKAGCCDAMGWASLQELATGLVVPGEFNFETL